MDERIQKLIDALKNKGKDYFVVVIDDKNTFTSSTINAEETLLRLIAAVGRTCERRLKRR